MPSGASFEQALTRLVLGPEAPLKLVALSEHSAALVDQGGNYVLAYRFANQGEEALTAHLKQVLKTFKAGILTIVLVGGGGASQQKILKDSQPLWSLNRRVRVMQVEDDGQLWTGPRTDPDSPLAQALRGPIAQAHSELSQFELHQVLERAIDPKADRRDEIMAFAKRMRAIRPWASWILTGLCGLMFVLAELVGGSEYVPAMIRLGANVPDLVIAGEYQRLASATFLHAGIIHLVMNGIGLIILGGFVERLLGASRLLVVALLSGLGGAVASAFLSSGSLSVGASGALFGLFGAAAALAYLPLVEVPGPVMAQLRRNIGFILLINLGISFLPRIDLWAHLGGGLVGFALLASRLMTGRPGTGKERPVWCIPLAAILSLGSLLSLTLPVLDTKPWELVQEPSWNRTQLGRTGITTELPQPILERKQRADNGSLKEFAFGDLGFDPVMLSITIGPGPEDLSDPKMAQEQFAQLESARAEQEIEGARRSGTGRTRTFAGVTTLEELFVYPSGVRHWRYSQLRPGKVVTLAVLIWDKGPAIWNNCHERVLNSLQGTSR